MNEVSLSVLIPTYNQPDYLKRALISLEQQTYKNFEVIITDDSEGDDIVKIADEFKNKLDIKFLKNKIRKGSPNNWNEGILHAKGNYIKFLHHDDWLYVDDALEIFVNALDLNPAVDIAFCDTNIVDSNQKILRIHRPSEKDILNLKTGPNTLFPKNVIGSPSAMIYRQNVGIFFDSHLKWVVDIDFYIRILSNNPNFVYIPQNLICCSQGLPGQITLECENNKCVELFEWIYLYCKINNKRLPYLKHIIFLWYLLSKYDVKNFTELRKCGVKKIPFYLFCLILARKIHAIGHSKLKLESMRTI